MVKPATGIRIQIHTLSKCLGTDCTNLLMQTFWRSEYISVMPGIMAGLCSEPHKNIEEAFFKNNLDCF